MLSRMGQRGDDQMPPLANKQVDEAGLALVTAYVHWWITSVASVAADQ